MNPSIRTRSWLLVGALGALAGGSAAWAMVAFHGQPALLATAALALGLGLRHAVDADHIAAIDNVTRKLVHDGHRPVAVGFFFSLGHSTVVVALCAAVAGISTALPSWLATVSRLAAGFGTTVSAVFLCVIAAANLAVLRSVWRDLKRMRSDDSSSAPSEPAIGGGLIARFCQRLFRMIRASWQMYPLGFLFGLGFDTATEVALLGLAARGAAAAMPWHNLMVFPLLFTAGMTVIDSVDGIVMLGVYRWAALDGRRKAYYNLAVTGASVVAAVAIAAVELLQWH